MVRRCRTTVIVIAAALAGPAAASANPVTACDNPADSALSQYCETIPSTGGGQTPGGGEQSLSVVLPRAVVAKILTGQSRTGAPSSASTGRHRRHPGAAALLTLPAPAAPAGHTSSSRSPTVAGAVPLSTWAIAIVAAMVLALGAGAVVKRARS